MPSVFKPRNPLFDLHPLPCIAHAVCRFWGCPNLRFGFATPKICCVREPVVQGACHARILWISNGNPQWVELKVGGGWGCGGYRELDRHYRRLLAYGPAWQAAAWIKKSGAKATRNFCDGGSSDGCRVLPELWETGCVEVDQDLATTCMSDSIHWKPSPSRTRTSPLSEDGPHVCLRHHATCWLTTPSMHMAFVDLARRRN